MSVPVDGRTVSRVARATLLGAVIACLGAIVAEPASAASQTTRTLVIKKAHNPVFKALKRTTDLSVDRSPPRGGRRGGKHDLLVLDGDALSARKMSRRRELHGFANSGRWVLALDVGSRHHRRALAKRTGFEALAEGRHRSRSFMFRHAVVDGVPRTLMLDTERLRPTGTHSVSPGKRRKSTRKEASRVAGLMADRLEASEGELAQVAGVAAPSPPQGADVPDEALRVGYSYVVTGSNHPRNGAYACGDPGYQVATWTMNHNFTVYLDNSVAHPQGDFQIVTYDLNGSFNPIGQGNFYNMNQTCTLAGGAQVPRDRSWWTGLVNSTVAPADTATDGKLTWQANQPNTPNREGTASSEETFTVGIATEGTEGTINASYTADHGKSFSIPDWGVISNTSGNRASWEFSSRHKCDPRSNQDPADNCFGEDVKIGYPNYPNDLSRGQIQVDTSARWRTKRLLDRGNGTLAFNVDTPVTVFDIACTSINLNICFPGSGRTVDNIRTGPSVQTYKFDASDAVPVPIKSVDLEPATANGAKNQKVTGTVTLDSPSPFTTKVVIFSSKENAVVGQPVTDQITQGTATINKGDTKGTFTIQTNDNHLASGRRVTAYITAFYGDAFDPVPLVVTSQP
jgi:hypothetical protein